MEKRPCEGVANVVEFMTAPTLPVTTNGTHRGQQRYTGPSGRDRRIDILRGGALVLFAIAVLAKAVDPESRAYDSTATVSALALVITLEGALIGMLHRPRIVTGLGTSTLHLWRRARAWYFSALAIAVGTVLIGLIPGVTTTAITTVDSDDHLSLFGATPVVESSSAISYPVNPDLVRDVVLLRIGPWPLDLAVLLCALLALAPLCLLALKRGRWVALLVTSVVIYAFELATQIRILPTRAEADLPLLGWQLVFVLGVIAGYYRRELVRWFRRGVGLAIFLVVSVASVVWLMLPAVIAARDQSVGVDLLAAIAGPQTGWLFEPSAPGPLRVVLTLVIVVGAYGALTVGWRPVSLIFGWLLTPIGSAVMPALVILVCSAVSTSSFAAADALYLPTPAIVAVIIAVMLGVSIAWRRIRRDKYIT